MGAGVILNNKIVVDYRNNSNRHQAKTMPEPVFILENKPASRQRYTEPKRGWPKIIIAIPVSNPYPYQLVCWWGYFIDSKVKKVSYETQYNCFMHYHFLITNYCLFI